MNFVPCVAWVSRGKAASAPHKLQLPPEELKRLVDESKELWKKNSVEDDEEENSPSESDQENEETCKELDDSQAEDNEDEDFDKRYNLNSYDNDDEQNPLFTINDIAVHVDNHDDDYITDQESEGDLDEKEDFQIKDTDNLLIVGHVEDTSSVLEIHVYNQEEDAFYVHHDIVLPCYPLSLAWLDFHPADEKPGNFIAIGDMSSVIKIYDLDVVDILEPDYTLGKMPKKKKTKKIQEKQTKYHSDAVLSLSWNKNVRNLLASGSADSSVIVWDLTEGTVLNKFTFHSNKVQALEWHLTESQFLLSGCVDGFLKLYDCRSDDECKSWKVEGEIERVVWNISDSFKFFCSTDQGYIYAFDIRNDEIERFFQAHKEGVTGLDISPLRPDMLISASMDKTLKVWDLSNDFKMIKSLKLKVGSIYTAKVAPDLDLTVAVGGNYASNSLKVIDIFKEKKETQGNEFTGTEVKIEKDEQENSYGHKKHFETQRNEKYKGTKVRIEKDEQGKSYGQRKYFETQGDEEFKDTKIKIEKNEHGKSNTHRKYFETQGNEDFISSKIKNVKDGQGKSNKQRKHFDTQVYNKSEENKLQKKKKKRKIYDTEENDSSFQASTSVIVASKHKEQKDFRRRK